MALESFLDGLRKIPEEERELRKEGWTFHEAVSIWLDYAVDEKGVQYKEREFQKTDKEILERLKARGFKEDSIKIGKGYYLDGKENSNVRWVYKKQK